MKQAVCTACGAEAELDGLDPAVEPCPDCGGLLRLRTRAEVLGEDADLPAELGPVWEAYHQLGTDFNGRPLYAEKLAYLDRHLPTEHHAVVLELWDGISAGRAEALAPAE